MRFTLAIVTALCGLLGACSSSTYITGKIDNQTGRDKPETYAHLVDLATAPLGFKFYGYDEASDSTFFTGPNKIKIQVLDNSLLTIYVTDPAGTCRSDTDVQIVQAIQAQFRQQYGVNVTFRCSVGGK